jgi:maleate isomerase
MKDYYGWRARIGLIYPSSSTVMEPELYAMAPDGVAIHTTRQDIGPVDAAGLAAWVAEDVVTRCTRQLAQAPLHAIVLGGTSASFLGGRDWDERILAVMAEASDGIPVTTAATAVREGLHTLQARRIVIATPYNEDVNECARRYYEQHGFEVLHCTGLGITVDQAISAVPLEQVYALARSSMRAGAEAMMISCTGLRTVGAIAALEHDLGVPVVSSNQACFWHALRLAGVREAVPGFGKLLTC